jgi:predicted nucleotidyltransferase
MESAVTSVIEEKKPLIIELCERHHVARLEAFGSALRGDFDRAESDFDFLVELMPMEPYARVEAYFGLLEGLRALLGREIDLVMVGAVKNPYIARQIQQTKQLLYAA